MRGGFDWNEFATEINAYNPVMKMNNSLNWVKYAINAPMLYKPGTRFQYNSGGVVILDYILKRKPECMPISMRVYLSGEWFAALALLVTCHFSCGKRIQLPGGLKDKKSQRRTIDYSIYENHPYG